MSKGRVLMAMSGGLDSSVAAMQLLEQNYEVVGCTFDTHCTPQIQEAYDLAVRLGIEHHVVDMSQVFRSQVICPFIEAYQQGLTPNPCVWCNAHIKWGQLMRLLPEYQCDYLATGHYARIAVLNGHYYLRRAKDEHKDQTYFLWMLDEASLSRTLFPLGDYTKQEVREMARQQGFVQLSQKTESQEICFIPNNDYRIFLQQEGIESQPGTYISTDGRPLGTHQGYSHYTIGQRKGLGIAMGAPAFVQKIDAARNEVTLGTHDELYAHQVCIRDGYFRGQTHAALTAQIRYRSKPTRVSILGLSSAYPQRLMLQFEEPVWAVAPGQSVAIYENDRLVGGGFICDLSALE